MAEEKDNKVKSKIAEKEEEILKFWKENKIFEKSLEKKSPKGEFVFYEGPPTANGKPGIHHLEARAFKDAIPRFKTMQGYHVRRKGGWDTHGLPVELQVEKELGLRSKKEIEEYGVAEFNKKCKESVWAYVDLWEKFTDRIGYWVDLENPYVTYENNYIEAVWNILKHVNKRKLLYKDYKVVPWCPRCGTGLSSHELAQGYEDVKDTSVTVKFKLLPGQKIGETVTDDKTFMLAWTTTPWTLPGNVALAVGEKIDYVKIKIGEESLILAKARISVIKGEYEIVSEMKGKDILGLEYEPLYPYLKENPPKSEEGKMKNAFKIYPADFVTTEDGTGVVHTAVMYGQDDFVLGNEVGLPKIHIVKEDGTFKEGMGFLSGRFVKEKDDKGKPTLDIDIFNDLREKGYYFSDEPYLHSYPFCWRCHTPLIYYARDSWYIRMSELRRDMVKENEKINWVPSHIKEGRFGEWLRDAKDWAISRERYWGTPLPIWQTAEGENVVIGSIADLRKHTKKSGNKYWTIRHGEAEENVKDLINSDIKNVFHLTEKGREQVKMAAADLKGKKIDLIIASPFTRCQETAEIVRQTLGLTQEAVINDDRVGELKKGPDFEGKEWSKYWATFESTKQRFEKAPDGGETLFDLHRRMGEFIYSIDKNYSNKNILIVSHDGPIEALLAVAEGADLKKAVAFKEGAVNRSSFAEVHEVAFMPLPHDENYMLDLHKPFIDEVELVDEEGNKLQRVKEVMDVWLDSGSVPFAQDGIESPLNNMYPADFISEAIDQTRGWFYTMHAISCLMDKERAYKNVICLGHILDANGKKMSKSLGNIVDPGEQIEKYGADALRMWMYTVNQPGDSKNFDEKTVDEVVKKIFNLASNVLSFYQLYRDLDVKPHNGSKNVLDKWILSRFNLMLSKGTQNLEKYFVFEAAREIRDLVNDFSTWYIRRSRDRFKSEDINDKKDALATTHFVLLELAKYMAPFTPFFAENLYLNLKGEKDPQSVHLCAWPEAGKVDEKILDNMEEVRKVVSLSLEKRMAAAIKVRQPLQKLKIKNSKIKNSEEYLSLIKDEINVKEVLFDESLSKEIELDTEITDELRKEGNIREIVRAIQDLRKQNNLKPQDSIDLSVDTDEAGKDLLASAAEEIKRPTNISEIVFESNGGKELKIENMSFKFSIKN